MGKVHRIKTWPQHFKEVKFGKKRFELRKNDRDYKTGDVLELQEFIPEEQIYSGELCHATVEYILHGPSFGLEKGHCIMSILII